MKLLLVNHVLDPQLGGGTAERTLQLAQAFSKEDVECDLLTLAIGDLSSVEKNIPSVHKQICINTRYFIPLISPWKLSKLIARVDAVHIMGHWTLLNVIVALICLLQHKPYVVCPAGALKNFGRSKWLKSAYDFIFGKRIISSANAWVAITEQEKRDFADYGIASESITVIPNGINSDDYINSDSHINKSTIDRRFSLKGQPYILFLGRLNRIKGPDLLLEAFSGVCEMFPELNLIFAGPDSGLLETLKSCAAEKGINKKVHFAGYLAGQEKVNALTNARFLVIPSREEAMSIVVLEASMCGTPVIFTDRCGLGDFAEKGAGIQVEATVDSIRQGLIEAMNTPDKMHESAKRLKKLVHTDFLWSIQAKRYLALYKEVIG